MSTPVLRRTSWLSPLGMLELWASERGLVYLGFPDSDDGRTGRWARRHFGPEAPSEAGRDDALFAAAIRQLDAYFAGALRAFDLPLDLRGTSFQLGVWRALLQLLWGETCSYAALAARIGRPQAARAVGAANGANPLSIIVPCHRLVAADGSLHAYGGGLERKAQLLALEAGHFSPQRRRGAEKTEGGGDKKSCCAPILSRTLEIKQSSIVNRQSK
jgi:methylated-DNA-[protein]-cysteine S-methyltransferase